jgi:hypothetical protein
LTGEEYGDDIAGFVWQDAPWLISGTVATLDGNLIVRDLQIRPSPTVFDEHGIPRPRRHPPDSGITMSVLRRLNLDQILHDVTETLATAGPRYEVWKRFMRERGIDPRGLVLADSRADEAAQRIATAKLRRGRKGYGDEHYREIAVLYLDVFAQGVRKGIHREIARRYAEARAEPADFHPVGTIRYWIAQAHTRGVLTEAHPGKAGAMPGPRLREERVGRKGKQQ